VIEVDISAGALPDAQIADALDAQRVCLLTGPLVGDRRAGLPAELVNRLASAAPRLNLHAISIEADGSKMRPAKAPAEHEPVLPTVTTLLAPMLGLDAVGGALTDRLFHRPELVAGALGLPDDQPAAQWGRFTPAQAARLLVSGLGGAKAQPDHARLLPIFNKADHPLRLLYGRLAAAHLAAQGQPALLAAVGAAEGEPVRERWGQVATVILAAGASTRLGRPKQLEPVGGEPLLLRALAVAASRPEPVYLVTGAYADQVRNLLARLPGSLAEVLAGRLHLIHNPAWAEGQATSLHASIRGLPATVEAAIWLPVDQPFLEPALLARLTAAWRQGADLVAPSVDGELRGAPALFDRRRWPALLAVTGDRGGRAVLQQYAAEVITIPTAAATLRDIDSPQDLRG
jgi:molybdenum cofactor cytidylyltransferase